MKWIWFNLLLFSCFCQQLRLNHISAIGTHNSYHIISPITIPDYDYDYSQAPLDFQLTHGVRSLELDISTEVVPYPVLHSWTFDNGTTCNNLVECLTLVRTWRAAQDLVPVSFFWIEAKSLFSVEEWDTFERQVLSVFSLNDIFTPDTFRYRSDSGDGSRRSPPFASVWEAWNTSGYPYLREAAGKVIFLTDQDYDNYHIDQHTNLVGRLAFPCCDLTVRGASSPNCVFLRGSQLNLSEVTSAAQDGYFIRVGTTFVPRHRPDSNAEAIAEYFRWLDINDDGVVSRNEAIKFATEIGEYSYTDAFLGAELILLICVGSPKISYMNLTEFQCAFNLLQLPAYDSWLNSTELNTMWEEMIEVGTHLLSTDYPGSWAGGGGPDGWVAPWLGNVSLPFVCNPVTTVPRGNGSGSSSVGTLLPECDLVAANADRRTLVNLLPSYYGAGSHLSISSLSSLLTLVLVMYHVFFSTFLNV